MNFSLEINYLFGRQKASSSTEVFNFRPEVESPASINRQMIVLFHFLKDAILVYFGGTKTLSHLKWESYHYTIELTQYKLFLAQSTVMNLIIIICINHPKTMPTSKSESWHKFIRWSFILFGRSDYIDWICVKTSTQLS